MLVLGRRIGESIVLSNGVRVLVTEVRGGSVRLGVIAPKDVVILREELRKENARCNDSRSHASEKGPRS